MMSFSAMAASLPGVELPGRRAKEVELARAPPGIKGGRKERGGCGREENGVCAEREGLASAKEGPACSTKGEVG